MRNTLAMSQDINPDFLLKIDYIFLLAQKKPTRRDQLEKAFDTIGTEVPALVLQNSKDLCSCVKEALEEWKEEKVALKE